MNHLEAMAVYAVFLAGMRLGIWIEQGRKRK